jgi:hypothetical protein
MSCSIQNPEYRRHSLFAVLIGAAASLQGCSAEANSDFGTLHLALSGASRGSEYELLAADFEIEGVSAATLTSDGDPSTTLSTSLPVGEYSVELQAGWQLVENTATGAEAVDAVLLSDNPLHFSIIAEETTEVSFVFQTGDVSVGLGEGSLALGIEIQKLVAREVVFSEVMKNPAALADTAGEWFELTNTGTRSLELEGCSVLRDGSGFEITSPLSVDSGTSITFANNAAPGFTPSYVYSGLSLPNAAAFTLSLVCAGETLDSITVNPALTPNAAGASLSLDPAAANPQGNDDATQWCDATSAYNTDLGTPGSANPACF